MAGEIHAVLPDGTTLVFPEGTPDEVVERTVRAQLWQANASTQPPPPAPLPEVTPEETGLGRVTEQPFVGEVPQSAEDIPAQFLAPGSEPQGALEAALGRVRSIGPAPSAGSRVLGSFVEGALGAGETLGRLLTMFVPRGPEMVEDLYADTRQEINRLGGMPTMVSPTRQDVMRSPLTALPALGTKVMVESWPWAALGEVAPIAKGAAPTERVAKTALTFGAMEAAPELVEGHPKEALERFASTAAGVAGFGAASHVLKTFMNVLRANGWNAKTAAAKARQYAKAWTTPVKGKSPEAQAIWREVVRRAHPDIVGTTPEMLEWSTDFIKRANTAYEAGDLATLERLGREADAKLAEAQARAQAEPKPQPEPAPEQPQAEPPVAEERPIEPVPERPVEETPIEGPQPVPPEMPAEPPTEAPAPTPEQIEAARKRLQEDVRRDFNEILPEPAVVPSGSIVAVREPGTGPETTRTLGRDARVLDVGSDEGIRNLGRLVWRMHKDYLLKQRDADQKIAELAESFQHDPEMLYRTLGEYTAQTMLAPETLPGARHDMFGHELARQLANMMDLDLIAGRDATRLVARLRPEPIRPTPETDPRTLFAEAQETTPTAETPPEAPKVERRKNLELRKRIEEMSPEEMRQALLYDHMTGLKSARAFEQDVKDHEGEVLAIDMDGLGFVNDTFGHEFGDQFIKAFGEALNRAAKMAGAEGRAYRKGGDEFTVLVDHETKGQVLVETLRRLLSEEPLEAADATGRVWTVRPEFSSGLGKTMEEADARLYEDKKQRTEAGIRSADKRKPPGGTVPRDREQGGEPSRRGEVPGKVVQAEEAHPAERVEPVPEPRRELTPEEEAQFKGLAEEEAARPEKPEKPAEIPKARAGEPVERFSEAIEKADAEGRRMTKARAVREAEEATGKTLASGKLKIKEVYDLSEAGLNRLLFKKAGRRTLDPFSEKPEVRAKILGEIIEKEKRLPAQTRRTEEQKAFQQYSTPPSYAHVAAVAAGIRSGEAVLEPSAGTGNLATAAATFKPGKLLLNELSEARLNILRQLGLPNAEILKEDARHIGGILANREELPQPDVVVMNPPFSATAGRLEGKKNAREGAEHVLSAFDALREGGRLVAILPGGREGGRAGGVSTANPRWDWFFQDLMRRGGRIRADIAVPGKVYKRFGTSFPTRLLVVDKGPRPEGGADLAVKRIADTASDLQDLYSKVRELGHERFSTPARERASDLQGVPEDQGLEGTPERVGAEEHPESRAGEAVRGGRAGAGVRAGRGDVGPREQRKGAEPSRTRTGARGTEPRGARNSARERVRVVDRGSSEGSRSLLDADSAELGAEPIRVEGGGLGAPKPDATPAEIERENVAFVRYQPTIKIPGSKDPPATLAEAAGLAAVPYPKVEYDLKVPKKIIESGAASSVQLEAAALFGQTFTQTIPGTDIRKGAVLADGTGAGKTRAYLTMSIDQWNRGRRRQIIIIPKPGLFPQLLADAEALGIPRDRFTLVKGKEHPPKGDGIVVATYSGLSVLDKEQRSKRKAEKITEAPTDIKSLPGRLRDILAWATESGRRGEQAFIVYDEAHNMQSLLEGAGEKDKGGGFMGQKKAALKAIYPNELQNRLPDAPVVYATATAAKEVRGLAYASRLGLWGQPDSRWKTASRFVADVEAGGIASMELVTQTLKARGQFVSRSLQMHDVEFRRIEHQLTEREKEVYTKVSEMWQVVLDNMDRALKLTDAQGSAAKAAAASRFWGAHQRFFNDMISSFLAKRLIKEVEKDLKDGKSVIIQLSRTGEADLERALMEVGPGTPLEGMDLTPKHTLRGFLLDAFPVEQYEEIVEDGIRKKRKVLDSEGKPVLNAEAVAMRDKLLADLEDIPMARVGVFEVLAHFGPEQVANLTGLTYGLVRDPQTNQLVVKKRSPNARKAELAAYHDGQKLIAMISAASCEGLNLHADPATKNTRKRSHYLFDPGWDATVALQGLGRGHRANQVSAPAITLLSLPDLPAQSRFVSTIARRLSELGALSRGSKDAAGDIYGELDNLENKYGREAIKRALAEVEDPEDFKKQTGIDPRTSEAPPTSKILNRLLMLRPDDQVAFFGRVHQHMAELIEEAKTKGTYESGTRTVPGLSVKEVERVTIQGSPESEDYVFLSHVESVRKRTAQPFPDWAVSRQEGFFAKDKRGRVHHLRVVSREVGGDRFAVLSPWGLRYKVMTDWRKQYTEVPSEEAKALWETQIPEVPTTRTSHYYLIGGPGALFYLSPSEYASLLRVQTDDGKLFAGAEIRQADAKVHLQRLGHKKVLGDLSQRVTKELAQNIQEDLLQRRGTLLHLSDGLILKEEAGRIRIMKESTAQIALSPIKDKYGLVQEFEAARPLYFVPVDEDAGTLYRILKDHPPDPDKGMLESNVYEDGRLYSMPGYMDPTSAALTATAKAVRAFFLGAKRPKDRVVIPEELAGEHEEVVERKSVAFFGTQEKTFRQKLKAALATAKTTARHFQHLDIKRSQRDAVVGEVLRVFEAIPEYSKAVAYRMVHEVTRDLGPKEVLIMTEWLALNDIVKDIEAGLYDNKPNAVPFGYQHPRLFKAAKALGIKMKREAGKNILERLKFLEKIIHHPDNGHLRDAIGKRQMMVEGLKSELLRLGLLKPEAVADPRYYHRQVLSYLNALEKDKHYTGTGTPKALKTRKASFQLRRVGGGDFSLNYHEAELEYMAQALSRIEERKAAEKIRSTVDIKDILEQQAKTANLQTFKQIMKERLAKGDDGLKKEYMRTRQKIAIGFSKLFRLAEAEALPELGYPGINKLIDRMSPEGQKDAEAAMRAAAARGEKLSPDAVPLDHVPKRVWQYLSALATTDVGEGTRAARTIFKGIAERENLIRGTLGSRFTTWKDLVPEDHTVWSPLPGKAFFKALSVPEYVLEKVIAEGGTIDPSQLKEVLALAPGEQWVIPKHIADQLNDLRRYEGGPVDRFARTLMASWKQWTLLMPLRLGKYNVNNLTGDADGVLALMDPAVFAEAPRAAKDLWAWQTGGRLSKDVETELNEALRLGVLGSGLSIQEIPDIDRTGAFSLLLKGAKNENIPVSLIMRYWDSVRNFTTWRENILRLAAWRHAKRRLERGDVFFWATPAEVVRALREQGQIDLLAARLARDALGDYGGISQAGQWLRSHLIPFYSWKEVNAKRYYNLMRNIIQETKESPEFQEEYRKRIKTMGPALAARFAFKAALKGAKWAVFASAFAGAIELWNQTFFPEENKRINRSRKNKHLILGHYPDGSLISIRFEGALYDFLEMAGLQDLPQDIRDLKAGKKAPMDVVTQGIKAMTDQVINGWEPFSKGLFEIATGTRTYPSIWIEGPGFKLAYRPIRSVGQHVAAIFSLQRVFAKLTDIPTPKSSGNPVRDILDWLLLYRTDPGEAAYWSARQLVVEFKKKLGKQYYAARPTERGNALYFWRRALAYGDTKTAEKWARRYVELGGTMKGLRQSMDRTNPLASLKEGEKSLFLQGLTPEERDVVRDALAWWNRMYAGGVSRRKGLASKDRGR